MKLLLSLKMWKRLCKNFTYATLVETYKTKGVKDATRLLRGEVSGKPQVVKTTAKIK